MAAIIPFKKYPDLLCNHDESKFLNIGYCAGTTSNSVPYEAELWYDERNLCLGVVLPHMEEFGPINTHEPPKKALPKIINFKKAKAIKDKDDAGDDVGRDFSLLCLGMVDKGEEAAEQTRINYIDFLQNEDLFEFLLSTNDALLVECSRSDKIWGNGISIHDEGWKNVRNWTGKNKLGRILMELRREFISMELMNDKTVCYNDAHELSNFWQWNLTPAELSRYPEYRKAIYAFVSTLSDGERSAFMYSNSTFLEWDNAMRTNMGGGLRIIGFYEMKQEIYDIGDFNMID